MEKCEVEDYCVGVQVVIFPVARQLRVFDLPRTCSAENYNGLGFVRKDLQLVHHLLGVHLPLLYIAVAQIVSFFEILDCVVNIRLLFAINGIGQCEAVFSIAVRYSRDI